MAKKRKLTKAELQAENEKMREEMKVEADSTDSAKVVEMLSKKNWVVYILCTFLPIIGIWYLWKKQENHSVRGNQMWLWTAIAVIIQIGYIQVLVNALSSL